MTEIHSVPQQTAPGACDRCTARGAFLAVLPGDGELVFCGHHHRAHRDRLLSRGALVWPIPKRVALDVVRDAA